MDTHTLISCPAKVLVGGGYLVLDPSYTGSVVATSSRFYAYYNHELLHELYPRKSNETNTSCAKHEINDQEALLLVFRSPQFSDAEWFYLIRWSPTSNVKDFNVTIKQMPDKHGSIGKNMFLETAALESFRVAFALEGENCLRTINYHAGKYDSYAPIGTVILLADNDFYSQPRDQTNILPFNRLDVPISSVHKTGLGSSAAMVTSVCAAILLRLTPSLTDGQGSRCFSKRGMTLIHNLSQYVHSMAQGKIGSGFDISAAVWGTHIYRRFAEECLRVPASTAIAEGSALAMLSVLDPQKNSGWTDPATAPRVEPFTLPPSTTMMLADVDAGSHTPSMVGKVLQWRKANPDQANVLWNSISILNQRLGQLCVRLNELYIKDQSAYDAAVLRLSRKADVEAAHDSRVSGSKPLSDQDDVASLFINLRATIQETRNLMRKMGEASDVPIEPPTQTELLDQCDELAGVIGSGVPGAGGYDAVWVLIYSPPEHVEKTGSDNVQKLWDRYTQVSVRALSRDACVKGGQSERPTGIRVEEIGDVKGLYDILTGARCMST